MTNQEMLTLCCVAVGLQDDVRLVDANGLRWTLEYEQNPSYPDFGRGMIKLEKMLQEKTHKLIDLRLQAKADKNKRFDRNYLRGIEKI